ncbi:hypothetical protein D3C86_1537570 [compost metagenome]
MGAGGPVQLQLRLVPRHAGRRLQLRPGQRHSRRRRRQQHQQPGKGRLGAVAARHRQAGGSLPAREIRWRGWRAEPRRRQEDPPLRPIPRRHHAHPAGGHRRLRPRLPPPPRRAALQPHPRLQPAPRERLGRRADQLPRRADRRPAPLRAGLEAADRQQPASRIRRVGRLPARGHGQAGAQLRPRRRPRPRPVRHHRPAGGRRQAVRVFRGAGAVRG